MVAILLHGCYLTASGPGLVRIGADLFRFLPSMCRTHGYFWGISPILAKRAARTSTMDPAGTIHTPSCNVDALDKGTVVAGRDQSSLLCSLCGNTSTSPLRFRPKRIRRRQRPVPSALR